MTNLYIDATGVYPMEEDDRPLTPREIAARVFDLLKGRGQHPVMTPESRDAAEHAAAMLLAAFGVPDPPPAES